MKTWKCAKCNNPGANIKFFSEMYECPKGHRIYHKGCLLDQGFGIVRKGFCPECKTEIHAHDRVNETNDYVFWIGLVAACALLIFSNKKENYCEGLYYNNDDINICVYGRDLVNLRERPTTNSAVVDKLIPQHVVKVQSCEDNWAKVTSGILWNKKSGFVYAKYIGPCVSE